jgi:hypothetical protein
MRSSGLPLSVAFVLLLAGCLKPPQPDHGAPASTQRLAVQTAPTHPASPTPTPAESVTATPTETPEPVAEIEPPSLLTYITDTTPPNVAAALRLSEEGRQLTQQGAYDRALDRLERAVQIDPTSAYGYYFLARLHYQQHAYDQAIAFADKAALLSAHRDRAWAARAYALQGAVFEMVGRFPDARDAYRKALLADPRNAAAHAGAARLGAPMDNP